MFKTFKLTALLEGISYLVLFGNMLFIKRFNADLGQSLVYPIGMIHGLLFIAYIILAIMLKDSQKWNIKTFLFICVASLIPFATFYIDKKYLQKDLSQQKSVDL